MRHLIFTQSKPVKHDVYGECCFEVWRVLEDPPPNTLQEPREEYVFRYYKNGRLLEEQTI